MARGSATSAGVEAAADRATRRPYFFWDYDISEEEVRRLVSEGTPAEQAWVISRILGYAKWDDIWRHLTIEDIQRNLDRLHFRRAQDRELWVYALRRWAKHG